MSARTSVDFSKKIAPIFKKYANTYGVKNTCSLGAILIHQLSPYEREELMGMIADETPIKELETHLAKVRIRKAQGLVKALKKGKKRIYADKL